MRGQSLIGTVVTMIILFFVISFAITLLPYILLGLVIWYFYRRLIRPLTGQSSQRETYKEKNYYTSKVEDEDIPPVNQVKSVHDDTFFKQDHDVVDVDYDENDK